MEAIATAQAETRQHVDVSIATAQAETRQHVGASIAALRQENAAAHAETRRHFDIGLEAARHATQLLAETVAHVDGRLTNVEGRLTRVEDRIERTAAETQAMFKFSHAELDRRVTTLEENVAASPPRAAPTARAPARKERVGDLQARVERLESSTH